MAGDGVNNGMIFNWDHETLTATQAHCFDKLDDLAIPLQVCGIPTTYGVAVVNASSGLALTAGYSSTILTRQLGETDTNSCDCLEPAGASCPTGEQTIWKQHGVVEEFTSNPPLLGVAAVSPTEAVIVGSAGIIRRCDMSGSSPVFDDEGTAQWERVFDGVFVYEDSEEDDIVYAVGQHLNIRRSTDGGETWDPDYEPSSGTNESWLSVDSGGENGDKLVAGGQSGRIGYADVDEPDDWTVSQIEDADLINAIAFAGDSDTVYAVCHNGNVFRSNNAGQSWTKKTMPDSTASLRGAAFVDPWLGYVVGVDGTTGVIFMTDDGGQSWTNIGITGSHEFAFEDIEVWGTLGLNAIAVGGRGRVFQRSGSGNFSAQTIDLDPGSGVETPTELLTDVEVLDDGDTVRIVGSLGRVLFRDDGVWTSPKSQTNQPLIRASFKSADHGFIFGYQFLVCEYE